MTRRYHLNLPFWFYSVLTVLVGAAAYTQQINLLYWLFGVMLAGLLISGLVSGVMMLSLRAVRLDPRHGAVGEPLVVRYAVTNRNPLLPAFNVHVEELAEDSDMDRPRRRGVRGWLQRLARRTKIVFEWPVHRRARAGLPGWRRLMAPASAWIMHVGPRETVHGEAVFWPGRRGEARFDRIRLWTSFPFGIIQKSVTISQPQHTLIYPRVVPLRRNVMAAVATEGPLGMRVTQSAGAGDDYFGMRDYRPGDHLRNIAWKRAAGLDQLVCIERSQPNPPRVRVIINLLHGQGAEELQEQAINLAASLIATVDRAGYEIGLSVLGVSSPPIRIRRSQWHVAKMMAALAAIDLDQPRFADRSLPPDAERAAAVVIHPDRVDPTIGRSDAWHITARQLVNLSLDQSAAAPRSDAKSDAPVSKSARKEAAA